MRKLRLLILFGFILLMIPKTFCIEYKTIYGSYENGQLGNSGKFNGLSSTNGGEQAYNVGQLYSNAIYGIRFGISTNLTSGKAYRMKVYMNDYDFRSPIDYSYIHVNNDTCTILSFNKENESSSGTFRTINFTFSCLYPYDYVWLAIQKYNNGYYYVTTANWQLNRASIEEVSDGTDNIINNNNTNTQNIINNQNQNTQDIINSNKSCELLDKDNINKDNWYLNANGTLEQDNRFGLIEYYKIDSTASLKVLSEWNNAYMSIAFYDTNKTKISQILLSNLSTGSDVSIPTNTQYVSLSIVKSNNKPTYQICKNGNQAITDGLNDLNDNIKDDSIGDSANDMGNFLNSFSTNTFGLTSIISAPLGLINSLLSSSCNDLEIPLPYLNNQKITLPCMTTIYSNYFGAFFTMYQTITYGIIAYWVCVRIFNQVKDFKNPDHDEIEVVDL